MPTTEFLLKWLVAWVILFVVFYFAAETSQRYLYDTVIERLVWRVLAITPILAAVLVKWPVPFEELFYNLPLTAIQGLLWFLACWLGLRFQWVHATVVALISVVLVGPIASSTLTRLVDSDQAFLFLRQLGVA